MAASCVGLGLVLPAPDAVPITPGRADGAYYIRVAYTEYYLLQKN
jgi:hypothetical protein